MPRPNPELTCEISGSSYDEGSFSDRVHKYIRGENIEELDQNLPGIFSNLNDFVVWFEGLTDELFKHTLKKLQTILPDGVNPEKVEYTVVYQIWDKIGFYLILNTQKLQLPPYLVLNFYRKFLQAFIQSQKRGRSWLRLHKGGIYHNLGISLLFSGEKEKSKSYFLLGMIEDILSQSTVEDNTFQAAPGYSNLKGLNVFGNESKEIGVIRKIIKRNKTLSSNIGVSPEVIFLEFMTSSNNKIKASQILLWDNIFFNLFLKETDRVASNFELGHLLELLSAYLFFTIGKFEVSCNIKTINAEHDLRVRNLISNDPILELLGRYMLVECKNWGKKVNSTIVKKFIANVRFARCDTGIMITKKSITGERGKDSAWYTIRAEYHRDNVVIMVITMRDLNKLAQENTNLLEMLKMKYETIRFDGR